jgi:catechol 2,3-dioxygenase-like lactoylglutathione lyase family enzyme
MATFLHTMVRITDPERSREFYEALGFRFSRDMDIVREGGSRLCFVRDPDDYRIELIERSGA